VSGGGDYDSRDPIFSPTPEPAATNVVPRYATTFLDVNKYSVLSLKTLPEKEKIKHGKEQQGRQAFVE